MARSSGFRDLMVWQKARDLTVRVYRMTRTFPSDERFGLTTQLRRASVSIVANIAEGTGRSTHGEFVNFLSIARGSTKEVDTLSEVAVRLEFLNQEDFQMVVQDCEEISRMIHGLQQRLRRGK